MATAIKTKNNDMVLVLSIKEAKGLAALAAIGLTYSMDHSEMFQNSVVKRAGVVATDVLTEELES